MRIGIDLGGTKIEGVVLDAAGRVRARRRVPTPRGYEPTLDALTDLVAALEREVGARATVGVGIPGAVTPATGRVKNANSTWLIGHPLGDDLARRLDRPVRLMNDANCFALSEAADGAGAGADVVFGVILGTGVGGGIVVGGRALVGPNLVAGEWGHNALPWPADDERPGPVCYCGRRGCIEAWLSGPALARDHHVHATNGAARALLDRPLQATSDEPMADAPAIVRRAAAGDPVAQGALTRYHERLARALASVVNLLDPDVIVLGGGLSHLPDLAGAVSALLPRHVFSDTVLTRVVPNVHGDASGVRGAAWLWPADAAA